MSAFLDNSRRVAATAMTILALSGTLGLCACAPGANPGSTGSAVEGSAALNVASETKEAEATGDAASDQAEDAQAEDSAAAGAQAQEAASGGQATASRQQNAASSSSSSSASSAQSSSSSSSSSSSESSSSGAHEHTWTTLVEGVYEDRPTVQVNWDRVHEIEAETGTQYSPETAYWFMNNFEGVAYEVTESVYVGNDYYYVCTTCGYKELYDQTRYL